MPARIAVALICTALAVVLLAIALGVLVGRPDPPTGDLVGVRHLKNWDSSSSPAVFYKSIQQSFKQGAVPTGSIVEVRKSDGTTPMTNMQADNRILWGDGSLRSARFSIKYPSQFSASVADDLKFISKAGTWNNTPWAAAITTIPATSNFLMQFVVGGTTYTCGANNEIGRGNYYQYSAGPTAVGLVTHGVFRNGTGANDADQGAAHCRIYITAWEDGTFTVMAKPYSCRSSNATCNAINVASAALKNGNEVVWSAGAFTWFGGTYFASADTDGQPYYSGPTAAKVVAAFPAPVLARPETTGLWDARLTPFYKVSAGAISAMNPAPKAIAYAPMAMGDYTGFSFNQTGGSPWIGWMPSSSAVAMWRGDWLSLRQDTVNALAGGAQIWHFRDAGNGNAVNLNGAATYPGMTQNPSIGWAVAGTISTPGGGPYGANQVGDASHIPNFYWYQWMYSGEEWWLDALHDAVNGIIGGQNPGTGVCWTRNPTLNGKTWWATNTVGAGNQMRAEAWAKREQGNAAWATPTSHPQYQYLQDVVAQNWGASEATISGPTTGPDCFTFSASWKALGLYFSTYNAGTGRSLGPWQYDYWTQALVLAVQRGQLSASSILITDVLTKFIVGRAAAGCAYSAAAYNFVISENNASSVPPFADDWSEVWAGTAGSSDTITAGGPLTDQDGKGCPTSGLSSFTDAFAQNAYPNILLGAARMAKALNIAGAAGVVTRFEAEAAAQGCCSDATVAAQPQWSIAEPQ